MNDSRDGAVGRGSKSPAAERVLDVLTYISRRKAPVGAQSVANALGLPRSSVYQLLDVLVKRGYLTHFPEERTYGLGLSSFELSSAFARQEPLARAARPIVERLVDTVGESGHAGVLRGHNVAYIYAERAPFKPSLVIDVGVRLPAHLTATGRALLGALPAAQLRALYSGQDVFDRRVAGRGPASLRELRSVLAADGARGYAVEEGEIMENFGSVAAGAVDRHGMPLAALTLTFLLHRHDAAAREGLAQHVVAAARELESRLR